MTKIIRQITFFFPLRYGPQRLRLPFQGAHISTLGHDQILGSLTCRNNYISMISPEHNCCCALIINTKTTISNFPINKKKPEDQEMKTHSYTTVSGIGCSTTKASGGSKIIVLICNEHDSEGFVTMPMPRYLINNELGSQSALYVDGIMS